MNPSPPLFFFSSDLVGCFTGWLLIDSVEPLGVVALDDEVVSDVVEVGRGRGEGGAV